MWFLEILENGQTLLRLKLPAAGLRLGGGPQADLQLPGVTETVRIEPARRTAFFTSADGKTEEIEPPAVVPFGRFTLRPTPADQAAPPAAAERTKWLRYDGETQTLNVTSAVLAVVAGPDAPREIDLEQMEIRLGSGGGCDIVLTDSYVSGGHARLQWTPGGWIVTDLDSRNGLFLDGVRVSQAVWPFGKRLRMGKTELELREAENREAIAPVATQSYAGLVGGSPAMRRLYGLIERLAPTDATVLIQGPTGSGKELVARALHNRGPRANGPFIAVNCGSMVRELVASELFGHARGAFTGATADRAGVFELAHGGTVFLDEIGELPLELQPHLLRVLEEREVRRVGANRNITVNVRVLAATHRDLRADVAAGRFREDLFYRLEMIPLTLPPLRERREDIPPLAAHLLEREAGRLRRAAPGLSPEALAALQAYDWPGNVRELANVLARGMILCGERATIAAGDLTLPGVAAPAWPAQGVWTLEETEKTMIRRALAECATRKEAAAKLDIALSTLYEKMKKYDLE
ncbi:MAG: sigma 54-dependent Fis family transcriptional regulator [Myxococcales bacterium]|nr:sigma 54-dependent Fis family transcriptional regulator [Myxococcales bacterium]